MVDEKLVQRLVAIIEVELLGRKEAPPDLQVIDGGLERARRRAETCRRIRILSKLFWFGWPVRMATGRADGDLSRLDDEALEALLAKMERLCDRAVA